MHIANIVEPVENAAEKHPQNASTRNNVTGDFRPNQSKIQQFK